MQVEPGAQKTIIVWEDEEDQKDWAWTLCLVLLTAKLFEYLIVGPACMTCLLIMQMPVFSSRGGPEVCWEFKCPTCVAVQLKDQISMFSAVEDVLSWGCCPAAVIDALVF